MKNKLIYNEGNVRKKVKAGKKVSLPDFTIANYGIEQLTVELGSESDLKTYKGKHEIIQAYLGLKHSKSASQIYANALYALTSPANTTLAGKLLSGEKHKASSTYASGNVPQAKDAIFGVLNTFARDYLGIVGTEVTLPKVKRTKPQVLELFKQGVKGFYVPQIDKDGLVVTAGKGKSYFDVNFVAVSEKEITREKLIEYFKAPFGESGKLYDIENFDIIFDDIVELCSTAYEKMCLKDDMYQSVRDIVHKCLEIYPLSFAEMNDPVRKKISAPDPKPIPVPPIPEPKPEPRPIPVPPIPEPVPEPKPVPVLPIPEPVPEPKPVPVPPIPEPSPEPKPVLNPEKYGLENIRESRVMGITKDGKLERMSRQSVLKFVELTDGEREKE